MGTTPYHLAFLKRKDTVLRNTIREDALSALHSETQRAVGERIAGSAYLQLSARISRSVVAEMSDALQVDSPIAANIRASLKRGRVQMLDARPVQMAPAKAVRRRRRTQRQDGVKRRSTQPRNLIHPEEKNCTVFMLVSILCGVAKRLDRQSLRAELTVGQRQRRRRLDLSSFTGLQLPPT